MMRVMYRQGVSPARRAITIAFANASFAVAYSALEPYNFHAGQWLGRIRRPPQRSHTTVNGLWGLHFGNGVAGGTQACCSGQHS